MSKCPTCGRDDELALGLTPKQLETARYIECRIHADGVSPTLQQIADHFVISKGATYDRVKAMLKLGVLARTPGARHRTFVIAEGIRLPGGGEE